MIEQLQAKSAGGEVDEMLSQAATVSGVKVVTSVCAPDRQGVKRLRDLSDRIKQKAANSIIILGMTKIRRMKEPLSWLQWGQELLRD